MSKLVLFSKISIIFSMFIIMIVITNKLTIVLFLFSIALLFYNSTHDKKKEQQDYVEIRKKQVKLQEETKDYTVKLKLDEPSTGILRTDFIEPKQNINDNKGHSSYSRIRKLVTDFVVLDFETTGLDPEENTIIQIAAVKYKNFEKVDEFITYINPIEEIPARITRITGITDEDVENSPYLGDMLPKLIDFINGNTLVAHNASFDMKFLLSSIHEYKLPYVKYRVIDTLTLSRKHIHTTNNHKLVTLKRYLKLNELKSHDALHDCYVTAELYKYCYEQSLVKN